MQDTDIDNFIQHQKAKLVNERQALNNVSIIIITVISYINCFVFVLFFLWKN